MNKLETREQAEARALELFPDTESSDYLWTLRAQQRKAYLKCWEDMNKQHNQLREAAEKVVLTKDFIVEALKHESPIDAKAGVDRLVVVVNELEKALK